MSDLQKCSLSVVILTKNEEKRLDDCLKSVSWASDIVVLDDCSTDQTEAIAKKHNARFIQREMDIEGRHRNFGYAQAREKWVLSLDADERVTPELAEEIKKAVFKDDAFVNGYGILRKNYIGDFWIRNGGWYRDHVLKLFRRDKFSYGEEEVHPPAFMEGVVLPLNGDLVHYSYNDFYDFISKLNRQTTLEAKKWFRTGRRMTLAHALRRTIDRFFRSWISKRGYKDGFVGFMIAIFAGLYQILSYAKYWEMKRGAQCHSEGVARGIYKSVDTPL